MKRIPEYIIGHPSSHSWNYDPGALPIMSSHCNQFEEQWFEYMIGYQDINLLNDHQGDKLYHAPMYYVIISLHSHPGNFLVIHTRRQGLSLPFFFLQYMKS